MEKKTPLYDKHVELHARIVPFAGFIMPIHYAGILEEHRAVRQGMGVFDLSHMGEFRVWGTQALDEVSQLVTNDVLGLEVGQARYTPMCDPNGGIVDDLLVYRFSDHVMLVVNASNIDKDLDWVRSHLAAETEVENVSDQTALIAIQGPHAAAFLQELTQVALAEIPYYHFVSGAVCGVEGVVSRTGYTGEDGFELYVAAEDAAGLWQELMSRGAPEGLQPIGLGARDTLRLEAGYMLYGNDIDQSTTPLEAGLGWTVKFDHNFLGREALERQKEEGVSRRLVALEMNGRAIPRPHYPLYAEGEQVGEVTSGTFSPTFERGIGLAYARTGHTRPGTDVEVDIRRTRHPAQIVRKPMYKRQGA